jgi:hypothetical protein
MSCSATHDVAASNDSAGKSVSSSLASPTRYSMPSGAVVSCCRAWSIIRGEISTAVTRAPRCAIAREK